MLKRSRSAAVAAVAFLVMGSLAWAAGNWSMLPIVGSASFCGSTVTGATSFGGATGQGQGTGGSLCAQTIPAGPPVLTGTELIPADTGLQTPATVVIPVGLLANLSGTPRNYLDNGSFNVQQRGTGTVTCGTTSGVPSTAYGPDRWGCDANVTSGAGRTAIVTTAALLPAGFAQVNTVFRTSGALTQPVCSMQEIPTVESTALAGKTVTLSFFAAALAGLAADNSNVITASIFSGTGSDQGLGTMTASPAITPAWTGIASAVSQQAITITTTPTRYSVTGSIPSTATEVGVAICFTPTATGAGATDGFAFTGAQLEVAPSPSAYEFHQISFDLARAQRFFYNVTEVAAGVVQSTVGSAQGTTTTCTTFVPFPVVMRAAPTYTNSLSATTFKIVSASQAATALGTPFSATLTANSVNGASINFTTTGMTAKDSCFLVGAGGGGAMQWTADF